MPEEIARLRLSMLVQRSMIAIIAIPALCCLTAVVFATNEVARCEFTVSIGVSDRTSLPVFALYYRNWYPYGWVGPILAALAVIFLLCRRRCSLAALISCLNFIALFMTVWLIFAGMAFYTANQTFWGWRRVVVNGEVFVDKGFRPGQIPLVRGGENLLPGELYSGKWGTQGTRNVLRRVVGTYREVKEEKTAEGEKVLDFKTTTKNSNDQRTEEEKGDSHEWHLNFRNCLAIQSLYVWRGLHKYG